MWRTTRAKLAAGRAPGFVLIQTANCRSTRILPSPSSFAAASAARLASPSLRRRRATGRSASRSRPRRTPRRPLLRRPTAKTIKTGTSGRTGKARVASGAAARSGITAGDPENGIAGKTSRRRRSRRIRQPAAVSALGATMKRRQSQPRRTRPRTPRTRRRKRRRMARTTRIGATGRAGKAATPESGLNQTTGSRAVGARIKSGRTGGPAMATRTRAGGNKKEVQEPPWTPLPPRSRQKS
mmetsp:Transcript_62935/g.147696  ORF Transcript_62935/g.147696 Transcript_62935/m.147696 type:complete len:240 (-) Transcript_62935:350-1069(-)